MLAPHGPAPPPGRGRRACRPRGRRLTSVSHLLTRDGGSEPGHFHLRAAREHRAVAAGAGGGRAETGTQGGSTGPARGPGLPGGGVEPRGAARRRHTQLDAINKTFIQTTAVQGTIQIKKKKKRRGTIVSTLHLRSSWRCLHSPSRARSPWVESCERRQDQRGGLGSPRLAFLHFP